MTSIRILLVDDPPMLRLGVRRSLENEESFAVAGECADLAALWTGLATVGAVVVELARLSWPVTALAFIVSCGGLVWSYRAVAAVMLRPAARWLQRIYPKS